jgi:hypothetical protein
VARRATRRSGIPLVLVHRLLHPVCVWSLQRRQRMNGRRLLRLVLLRCRRMLLLLLLLSLLGMRLRLWLVVLVGPRLE